MADVRLMLGDCLEAMRTLPDASVDCVITDPPYGIGYTHGNQSAAGRSSKQVQWESIEGDDAVDGEWLRETFRLLKQGSALYLVTRWDVEPQWRREIEDAGFTLKQRLTWHKRVNGKGDLKGTFQPTCEDVLFATKGRHLLNSRPSMLLDAGCVPTWEIRHHPHQKPIALMGMLLSASTQPGDTILDPFAGSGSTGVAAVQLGRNFVGCEISSDYFAIAQRRIELAQAQPALLEVA